MPTPGEHYVPGDDMPAPFAAAARRQLIPWLSGLEREVPAALAVIDART